ncbi:hypothetical protein RJ640_010640 [Escallonia rubra]|uniref:Uncharacterized protein n=1 Tax=Escallonia rubra TaxID=112253 RepID=A0AA88QM13_9ASTE|nr:hypothetical protein RJ640_010640 [Escallonia rubra]
MGKIALFDLERQYAIHGAFHSNPVNVVIHFLFVWPIFLNFLVLLHFTPFPFDSFQVEFYSVNLVFNFGFLFTLAHALFFISFDKKAGSLAALLCFSCWVLGSSIANYLGSSLAWKVALAAQIFCIIMVNIGHIAFEWQKQPSDALESLPLAVLMSPIAELLEKRVQKQAPALSDSLNLTILVEPFLVLLEALQMFCGYEPYPGFHARVRAKMEAETKGWQDKDHKKVS